MFLRVTVFQFNLLTPSDFDAKSDFSKMFVTKNLLIWTILILSML